MSEDQKSWLKLSEREISRIKKSISSSEKRQLLKGMLLTRATDNALKHMFLSGAMVYQGVGFQGKGFRSLGQEAIYGATLRLKIGKKHLDNRIYTGDVAGPLIRDLGVFLSMSDHDVKTAINAQAGKTGKPCHGRDLHLGDFARGIVLAAAPLAISTCTLLGMALAFKLRKVSRVALSFIGDGGSSLGEWHEAINMAAVFSLPMVFCIENNQTALSTPISSQTKAKSFAHKALAYGINALTVDGNDVEAIAASFSFAGEHARAGSGPVLIEIITMRMCGHAHHDDMLYLGHDPILSFTIPKVKPGGYADKALYEEWSAKDPIALYEHRLINDGVMSKNEAELFKQQALMQVEKAIKTIKARPWPRFSYADDKLVFKKPWLFVKKFKQSKDPGFVSTGFTYLQAIAAGIKEAFLRHKNCLVIGEDVATPYGNAFMMFKPIMGEFAGRFINTPISENAIVGACVGLAMNGFRPIGELQFNDFVACCMNQVVNNAAKCYFRSGINIPLVIRMPYGGLRRAGPFHSEDTSPWFFRTPGLKIMAPSCPIDAFWMIQKAVDDKDPVLFYEHIALYRDSTIKQALSFSQPYDIEGAKIITPGNDITVISYGAFSHIASRLGKKLNSHHGISAEVIDLRYLMPIDFATIYTSVKKTSRLLLVGEDKNNGSILQSIASTVGQELWSHLDAPVTVIGSRNIPVPYAPSLEDDYLKSEQHLVAEALKLSSY